MVKVNKMYQNIWKYQKNSRMSAWFCTISENIFKISIRNHSSNTIYRS